MSERTYNSTSPVTEELIKTIFEEKPVFEKMEDGTDGKLISGYSEIFLYGAMGQGKTTDIIKTFERVCMYQTPYKGKRQMRIGVLRNSNADFSETFGQSVDEWYEYHDNKKFKYGYTIYDMNSRPKVLIRFPSVRPQEVDGVWQFVDEGMDCEITYVCYAANKAEDQKKLKGALLSAAVGNEVNNNTKEQYEMMCSRVDRFPPDSCDFPIVISDANPTHKKSWDYEYFFDPKNTLVKKIQYPSPLKFVPDKKGKHTFRDVIGEWEVNEEAVIHRKGYAYWFKMLNKSETFILNNVLGEYADFLEGTVVHPEFSASNIKEVTIRNTYPIICGVDFGVKCGAVLVAFDNKEKPLVFADFWGATGFRNLFHDLLIPYIKENLPHNYKMKNILFVGDPRTGGKKMATDFGEALRYITDDGFQYAVPRDPTTNKIVDGIDFRIEAVGESLMNGMLVDTDANITIDAFSFGYIRDDHTLLPDKRKSGKYAEIMDSLQYVLTYVKLDGDMGVSTSKHGIRHAY